MKVLLGPEQLDPSVTGAYLDDDPGLAFEIALKYRNVLPPFAELRLTGQALRTAYSELVHLPGAR